MRAWLLRYWRSFSITGLLLGTLFFAFSLTPSLVPRVAMLQGILSGASFAVGYALGAAGIWLWDYLELRRPDRRWEYRVKSVATVICLSVAILFLWRAAFWQDGIRRLMELEPTETAHPFAVGSIAVMVFILVMLAARLFNRCLDAVAVRLKRYVPRRVANVVGFAAVALIFVLLVDGLVFRTALRLADASYENLDRFIDVQTERPQDPTKTGGPASLITWNSLGRMGRRFISSGPTKAQLSEFAGAPAQAPIRVYAGLRSADTPALRAKLALRELVRVGAFERSVLIVAAPTGTGWLDPSAVDTVEYLHGGDTAIVSVQYSYLASWMSLLFEPGYGTETARALFVEVYRHWARLPKETRPRFYLHGLSLGALSSQASAELYEVIANPYHGALWSGPPFPSSLWRTMSDNRDPGSPAWLPRFGDGSYVRFTAQKNALPEQGSHWGPMRVVYLQYASDPITFFEPQIAWRSPAWLAGRRGPDVSPDLRWYPLVTFLQLVVDMMVAHNTPMGYGHVYAPEHYIDGWVAVTDPPGWTDERISHLKKHFAR